MMLKRYFVNQAIKEVQIEEFIRKKFPEGDYSRMELQRTPLGIKVVIWSPRPGRIIGRGGKTINDMTAALKERFKLENPQLDVKSVAQPNLDARLVAKQIALALERGFNFKRIGNTMLKRVMDAGAIGCEVIISGRASGGKAMTAKFIDGYLKHSGEPAKTQVDYGFEEVYQIGKSKPGKVGIKVKIMKEFTLITGEIKYSLKDIKPTPVQPDAAEPDEPASEKESAPAEATPVQQAGKTKPAVSAKKEKPSTKSAKTSTKKSKEKAAAKKAEPKKPVEKA